MAEHHITANKTQNEEERDDMDDNNSNNGDAEATEASRKERRKLAKKEKRKKKRKELAEMARQLEEARLNDPEELRRLQAEEEMEKARIEKERLEFEEREKKILEEWERRRALEEEEEERRRRAREEEDRLKGNKDENDMDEDGWEYVEEGPPEIIWKGNEIIVQKKKVRVKKNTDQQITKEDPNRPTSNPLPPQSEAFASYTNGAIPSAQQLLENVANQTPNFGTEQDKAHCPFHHKTGACRFGTNCSRIHFYPDKSCTLLIKNMYNGPGLAWEQDEGLECTDEEVEHAYEEFYEDVHTEFLKFGEIINFKVCKNCSPHLRGNVYVHYKSLDSAVLAYKSLNGRYFAGKQVQCEFVSLTKWRVAICGEFMRSKLKTCSRGVACNFIHCFQNPGGDYEWADWDKPPPRYWVQRMVALFGCSGESAYEIERESPKSHSSRKSTVDADRSHHFRRSQSRDIDYSRGSRNHYEDDTQSRAERRQHRRATSRTPELDEKHRNDRSSSRSMQHRSDASTDSDTDRTMPERERTRHGSKKRSRFHINRSPESIGRKIEIHEADADLISSDEEKYHKHNSTTHKKRRTQEVGRGCNAKSKEISSVKGKGKDVRQHRKVSKSPDDCCMDDRRTDKGKSTGSRCNRKDEYTCAEKCSTPDDYEEYGNEKSKANHSIRRGGDSKHASTERSYGIYGSRSRKFTSKWEREDSGRKYKKEPKRKREAENSDPESQLRRLEGRRSSMADDQFDEDTEDRGRWEPE